MKAAALNGSDYFILMVDEAMRREGLAGITCAAHISLEEVPLEEELRACGKEWIKANPWLGSQLKFTPVLGRARWNPARFEEVPVYSASSLEGVLNRPLDPRVGAPLEMVRLPGGVAVRWHHALLDARGMEALLLGEEFAGPRGREFSPDLKRHSFFRRVAMSLRMRKRLRAIEDRLPAHFRHGDNAAQGYEFRLEGFTSSETEGIWQRATAACGFRQKNLYLLAGTFRALQGSLQGAGPMVVPVPVNLRKPAWSPVVTNYFIFLHFELPQDTNGSLADTARALKEMHRNQVRQHEDADMISLLHMGRWLRMNRYLRERTSREGRERVTAYFSYPGTARLKTFLGRDVLEYRAFSAIPSRPGLGVFFQESGRDLLFTVVSVRGCVEEREVDAFISRLRKLL